MSVGGVCLTAEACSRATSGGNDHLGLGVAVAVTELNDRPALRAPTHGLHDLFLMPAEARQCRASKAKVTRSPERVPEPKDGEQTGATGQAVRSKAGGREWSLKGAGCTSERSSKRKPAGFEGQSMATRQHAALDDVAGRHANTMPSANRESKACASTGRRTGWPSQW